MIKFATVDPLDSLKASLTRDQFKRMNLSLHYLVDGQNTVYTTPLFKKSGTIIKQVESMFEKRRDELDPELYQLEMSNRENVGPKSIAIPFVERIPQLEETYSAYKGADPQSLKINLSAYSSVRKYVNQVREYSVDRASKFLKKNTGAGYPYFMKKGLVLNQAIQDMGSMDYRNYPGILATRTQFRKKTRDVWVVAIQRILREMQIFVPLLEVEKRFPWRKALVSPTEVDHGITSMMEFRKANPRFTFLSIDFKHYDASVKGPIMIRAAEFLSQFMRQSSAVSFMEIVENLTTMPLITPDGVLHGSHGMPSGSTFTNALDSAVQYSIAKSEMSHIGDLQIQGDDGVYLTDDPDALISAFKDFGLVVNEDKSYVSDAYCVYLQNYYSDRYRSITDPADLGGVYPVWRALANILYSERYADFEEYDISGMSYFSISTRMKLENTRNHPFFRQFVKLIWTADKYKLKYRREDLARFVKRHAESKGAGDLVANQYGDKPEGLESFEVSKVIRDLESKG